MMHYIKTNYRGVYNVITDHINRDLINKISNFVNESTFLQRSMTVGYKRLSWGKENNDCNIQPCESIQWILELITRPDILEPRFQKTRENNSRFATILLKLKPQFKVIR